MRDGVSPVVATVLLIAIAVIASVTIWFWTSSYTAKPALAETAVKSFAIVNVYKNSSNDGCVALDIKNAGGSAISNAVFEVRDYQTGEPAGMGGMWLQDSGLVSYWNFDEAIGNASRDATPRGNNGTYYGEKAYDGSSNGCPSWVIGKSGSALEFNGGICYVSTTYNETFSQNMTVTVWFKIKSWGWHAVAGRFHNNRGWDQGWMLYRNGGDTQNTLRWLFYYNNTGGTVSSVTGTITYTGLATDTWYHAAASIYSNGSYISYLNGDVYSGMLTASNFASWGGNNTDPSKMVWIGSGGPGVGWYFNGTVDSVRMWNRTLNQTEIQAEMNSARPVARPIAAWELDEGAGTAVNDTHIWTAGMFNSGISFDGLNDYFDMGSSSSLHPASGFTLSAWINRASAKNAEIIQKGSATFGGGGSGTDYELGFVTNLYFQFYGSNSVMNSVWKASPSLNAWHHIAAVFAPSQSITVYIDGTAVINSTTSSSTEASTGGVKISHPTWVVNGTIDDVSIFNRSLSASEISFLYAEGKSLGELAKQSYLNITIELSPGSSQNYNFSMLGNASNRVSLPRGAYILRASTPGYSDQKFTCA